MPIGIETRHEYGIRLVEESHNEGRMPIGIETLLAEVVCQAAEGHNEGRMPIGIETPDFLHVPAHLESQ